MSKYKDEKRKQSISYNWIRYQEDYDYLEGTIKHPLGIIYCYSQGGERSIHHTRIEFIKDGYCYERRWQKRYTKRGLSVLANKFIREIIKEQK